MSKTLTKKGLNTDIINYIYSFLTYKDEFDKVIQHLNQACISNCQHPRPLGSAPVWPTPSVIWKRCNKTNKYYKSFVWWPPTLSLFGKKGYIVLIDFNESI